MFIFDFDGVITEPTFSGEDGRFFEYNTNINELFEIRAKEFAQGINCYQYCKPVKPIVDFINNLNEKIIIISIVTSSIESEYKIKVLKELFDINKIQFIGVANNKCKAQVLSTYNTDNTIYIDDNSYNLNEIEQILDKDMPHKIKLWHLSTLLNYMEEIK